MQGVCTTCGPWCSVHPCRPHLPPPLWPNRPHSKSRKSAKPDRSLVGYSNLLWQTRTVRYGALRADATAFVKGFIKLYHSSICAPHARRHRPYPSLLLVQSTWAFTHNSLALTQKRLFDIPPASAHPILQPDNPNGRAAPHHHDRRRASPTRRGGAFAQPTSSFSAAAAAASGHAMVALQKKTPADRKRIAPCKKPRSSVGCTFQEKWLKVYIRLAPVRRQPG